MLFSLERTTFIEMLHVNFRTVIFLQTDLVIFTYFSTTVWIGVLHLCHSDPSML